MSTSRAASWCAGVCVATWLATGVHAQPSPTPPSDPAPRVPVPDLPMPSAPQPAEPPPPPIDPAVARSSSILEPELLRIEAPMGWSRVEDERVVWTTRAGRFVSVGAQDGTCLARGGFADPVRPGYYQLPRGALDRFTLCLQRIGGVALVTIGNPLGVPVVPESEAAIATLVAAIAERLRPSVVIPIVGVTLRPLLALEPTADGFAVHGLSRPTRVTLVAVPGACGMVPPGRADALAREAPRLLGRWWSGHPRGDDDAVAYCLERRRDAVQVIVDAPVFTVPPAPRALGSPLVELLSALHDAIAGAGEAPRLFGPADGVLALPRTGVTLRDTLALDAGWMLRATPSIRFKLVDGADWGEPDMDLLLPAAPYRYAIGFRREACERATAPRPPREAALFPAALGAVHVVGSGVGWRATACAAGARGTFAIVVRALGRDDASEAPRDARAVATSFARSVGVDVPGTPFRVEGLALLTVPIVWFEDQPREWGLAFRVRTKGLWRRPLGLVGVFELALGAGGDDFHPGVEEVDEEGKREQLPGDALLELRVGGGVAASAGPFTVEGMAAVVAPGYWPATAPLEVSIGAGIHIGRSHLQARYARTLFDPAHTIEGVLAAPPFAVLVKLVGFSPEAPGYLEAKRPRLGVELGVGAAF